MLKKTQPGRREFQINRRANIGAGALTIMIEVYSNLNPDLDNIFFLVIKILALLSVIWVAWKWPVVD